jgi:hypothetical protein
MSTSVVHSPTEEQVRDGVRNLVEEVARVARGEQVLVLSEYGRVDRDLPDLIGDAVRQAGAVCQVMWSDGIAPDSKGRPEILIKAMQAADRIIYNFPAGSVGQRFISVVDLFLDRDSGPLRVTNNFCTIELIASDYARFSGRAVSAIYEWFEETYSAARTWRITSPSGTDIGGQTAQVSSRQAILEGVKSLYSVVFPVRIHCPIGSAGASGTIAVDHCAIPPVRIENPPLVTVENDLVTAIEGGREANDYRKALAANAERWGERANYLDSWHSGLHPHGPNIEGFLGHGCSARMHMHIGRSDTYTSAGLRDHTIEIDGNVLLDQGRLVILDDPQIRKALGL